MGVRRFSSPVGRPSATRVKIGPVDLSSSPLPLTGQVKYIEKSNQYVHV